MAWLILSTVTDKAYDHEEFKSQTKFFRYRFWKGQDLMLRAVSNEDATTDNLLVVHRQLHIMFITCLVVLKGFNG